MIIKREKYLNLLTHKKNNSLIKVITGLRRSGKSYLLNELFYKELLADGVDKTCIIKFAFDNDENIDLLEKYYPEEKTKIFDRYGNYTINSKKFRAYIKDLTNEDNYYYLFLDEIQLLDSFVGTLNGFLGHTNYDVYVTGSNSKMLSSDIITEFRGRGDEIYISPLSFKEYYEVSNLSFDEAYSQYQFYGGMPYLCELEKEEDKQKYLKRLFEEIYIKDIVDRNHLKNETSFTTLLKVLASSVGSYTNPKNIENTFKSELNVLYSHDTIKKHIDYIIDSFILSEANRYDIKGKKYIGANAKYYFTDIGLRNALINFRQEEPTHLMENIIYNELINRGYSVDVGIVEISEANDKGNFIKKQLETDFVCNKINEKIYIQSCYTLADVDKVKQEKRSLLNIKDSFRKIIIVKDYIKKFYTEDGIEVINLKDFLLNDKI